MLFEVFEKFKKKIYEKKLKEIKIDFKSINYFYMKFQTHLTYFNCFIKKLSNLKIHNFLIILYYIIFYNF